MKMDETEKGEEGDKTQIELDKLLNQKKEETEALKRLMDYFKKSDNFFPNSKPEEDKI